MSGGGEVVPTPRRGPVQLCREPLMTSNKRIPSLDGLRAVSICLVLLSHSYDQLHETPSTPVWRIVGNGQLGVSIFFVISGYLITSLLLRELDAHGRIDLRDFYVKRAFR